MSYLLNNEQKMNEIIFAHRNKAYGAYVLRSDYGSTVAKSLSIVVFSVAALALTAYLFTRRSPDSPSLAGQVIVHDSVYVIPYRQPEDPKPEPQQKRTDPSTSSGKPAATENGKPVVIDSTRIDNSQAVTTTVNTSPISTVTSIGDNTTTTTSHTFSEHGSSSTPQVLTAPEVDSEPEFEGGLPALYRFVSQHLRYPQRAFDEGIEGPVYVRFIVDEQGRVGNLTLLNSKGFGLDDEALRVVGMIPKFRSPAKAKGQPVKMYYQLPIRFRLAH